MHVAHSSVVKTQSPYQIETTLSSTRRKIKR